MSRKPWQDYYLVNLKSSRKNVVRLSLYGNDISVHSFSGHFEYHLFVGIVLGTVGDEKRKIQPFIHSPFTHALINLIFIEYLQLPWP